jgi:AhpD family alkylhydroperoxidase
MRPARLVLAILVFGAVPALAQQNPDPETQATYQDIQRTLGLVPQFLRLFPQDAISAAWQELKDLELNPRTAVPARYKELIGLGVAAQVPCRYCTYFHTAVAQLSGASERETREAVTMAALTRKWSTVLNGLQIDEATFKSEVQRVFAHARNPPPMRGPVRPVTDPASAYADMEQTLGLVPSFFRAYPAAAVAAAWRTYKAVELAPSVLPTKYKELVGLAVASQIPCRYCVYFHTEAARMNGASDAEIREAVAISSHTRFWSTFLNGSQIDETTFRRETDQIMANMRKRTKVSSR